MAKKKIEKDVILRVLLVKGDGEDKLCVYTTDGMVREFKDDGQCCCEDRYMTCNEEGLDYFIGATYLGYDISDFTQEDDVEGYINEAQLLNIRTDRGVFTVVTHNEHNGYYGGFNVVMSCKPLKTNGKELLEKIEKKK